MTGETNAEGGFGAVKARQRNLVKRRPDSQSDGLATVVSTKHVPTERGSKKQHEKVL